MVLMEASASSKPCISTKHAGIPEIVLDEKTGFLVDEKDVESLAAKMVVLYDDEKLRQKMGDRGRQHIKE